MAITADKSPYKLTAVGDNLADVFQGRDMQDTTPVCKYKCTQIRVACGASGPVILLDKAGGELIFSGQSANTGDVLDTAFGEDVWLDGCYVQSLPANSVVYIYVN